MTDKDLELSFFYSFFLFASEMSQMRMNADQWLSEIFDDMTRVSLVIIEDVSATTP